MPGHAILPDYARHPQEKYTKKTKGAGGPGVSEGGYWRLGDPRATQEGEGRGVTRPRSKP